MKKRDIITIAILGIIFVFIAVIIITIEKKQGDNIKSEYEKLTLLTDEQMFLTVANNINNISIYSNSNIRALNYISKDEIDEEDYKNTTFQAKEIYVISNVDLYKYYVKGSFYTDLYNQNAEFIRDEYFILNHNVSNGAYSIEKISKKIYDNAKDEEYTFETVGSNDYNKFKFTTLSSKSRATLYFYDFLKKMYNNTEEAYELLTTTTKQNYFYTYDEFTQFILNNKNISIKEYSVNDDKIGIKDNNNNEYVFNISYVLDYTVTIYKAEE